MRRLWLSAALLAAGCLDLKAGYPERRFYVLEAARTGMARKSAAGSIVRVHRFSASRASETSEFVYQTGPSEYQSDFYNAFFSPPAQQIAEQTRRWLERSGVFGTVIAAGSAARETCVLEGNLISLRADFQSEPAAVIEIQFLLVSVLAEPPSPAMQKSYRQQIALSKKDAQGVVRAWDEGLARILSELEEDLSRVPLPTRK